MHLDHDLLEIWRFQKIAFEKTFPATSDLTFGNSTLKKKIEPNRVSELRILLISDSNLLVIFATGLTYLLTS